MTNHSQDLHLSGVPTIVDRAAFEAEIQTIRTREKAHTHEGDAIAAERRRLPMVEVDSALPLLSQSGPATLLDAFEGRQQLLAYYFMWSPGLTAAEQCEGCTFFTSQIHELSYLHTRDVTYAVFCQGRCVSTDPPREPEDEATRYKESLRYRDFMGWAMPWYSAHESLETLLTGRHIGLFHLVSYLRDGDRVFETYWTTGRGVEVMDNNYALMDLTTYGRQEDWQDSPPEWQSKWKTDSLPHRTDGRPTAQLSRLKAGYSDDLSGKND